MGFGRRGGLRRHGTHVVAGVTVMAARLRQTKRRDRCGTLAERRADAARPCRRRTASGDCLEAFSSGREGRSRHRKGLQLRGMCVGRGGKDGNAEGEGENGSHGGLSDRSRLSRTKRPANRKRSTGRQTVRTTSL
ncbi:hypothetical protein ASG43_13550 [Aureimonas sp. Leaf454]|nr:hypothetical protein ASG43_13550 [Aureimonas sp. Leaf454]